MQYLWKNIQWGKDSRVSQVYLALTHFKPNVYRYVVCEQPFPSLPCFKKQIKLTHDERLIENQ